MRAKPRIAIAVVVAVAAAGFAFLAPSRAATPVVFFSGDVLADHGSNFGVKAFNSKGHAINVTVTVFRLDGTQPSGSPFSFNVPAHQTHVFNFVVPGVVGNCECTARVRAASGGIFPSLQYIPAGATQQVDVPAGSFRKTSTTQQNFFSGDVLADHASNFGVKAHNSTNHNISVAAHVFRLDGSEVAALSPVSILPHQTHVFNFSVPGVVGNCECTARIFAAKPGIIPSLQYIPAGATQQVDVPAGAWQ